MIALLLAQGFEEVEAVTPLDYLRRAGLKVQTVGIGSKIIKGSHDITLQADLEITENSSELQNCQAVVIPGGMPGARNIAQSAPAVALIRDTAARGGLVAAICAAPAMVLAPLGLLKGKKATCFPGYEKEITDGHFSAERVVVDGKIITSRAAGTAAEFSLGIIEALIDRAAADKIKSATLVK